MESTRTMSRGSAHRRRAAVLVLLAGITGQAWAEDRTLGPLPTNPLDAVSSESLSAFRTRPLFAPTRTETPPPAVEQPAPAAAPPQAALEPPSVKLVGIIDGRTRLAVVRIGDAVKARMIASGDMLESWRATVLDTGLRLTSGDRTVEIALFASAAAGRTSMPKPGATPTEAPNLPPPQ